MHKRTADNPRRRFPPTPPPTALPNPHPPLPHAPLRACQTWQTIRGVTSITASNIGSIKQSFKASWDRLEAVLERRVRGHHGHGHRLHHQEDAAATGRHRLPHAYHAG